MPPRKTLRKSSSQNNFSLLTVKKEWKDLVLNQRTAQLINDLSVALQKTILLKDSKIQKKKKSSIIILFYGPSGSGKTLAADLLGKQLGIDVYRIDLSQVVSKYIGETEKNLERIFSEAENKSWILFFDEADALFGKRSEVKDSHDRYANIEISYLLKRIENYNGLVILASNSKTNIDASFIRRLKYKIEFRNP